MEKLSEQEKKALFKLTCYEFVKKYGTSTHEKNDWDELVRLGYENGYVALESYNQYIDGKSFATLSIMQICLQMAQSVVLVEVFNLLDGSFEKLILGKNIDLEKNEIDISKK